MIIKNKVETGVSESWATMNKHAVKKYSEKKTNFPSNCCQCSIINVYALVLFMLIDLVVNIFLLSELLCFLLAFCLLFVQKKFAIIYKQVANI